MTNNEQKLVTVLMAVHDEKREFLDRSIGSILNQTYKNLEFLIIDDGSTQKECLETLDNYVARDGRIKLFHNEKNLGLPKSLNKGLQLAKGEYIARIDADDISDIQRLEKQVDFMEKNPDYALCGSWSYIINEQEEIIGYKKFPTDSEEIRKKILFFNFFTHSSLFFKKSASDETRGYNEKIKKAQDYDFILKISGRHQIANIGEFLCFHRTREGSISAKGKKRQEWYAIIARLKAVFFYGYPKTYFWKVVPSFFYFLLVPYFIEKQIFKFLWKK